MMVLDTTRSLVPTAPALQIDEGALLRYLLAAVPSFPAVDRLQVFQFSHGQSNPTYLVQAGSERYVLRKKPPGKVLPSAHAVEREFRVLLALQATPVPVPRVLTLCQDASVIGTPFYLMQHVAGRIFVDPTLPNSTPEHRSQAYAAMARTLAALHRVVPGDVGLAGYGKSTGYNQRQVWRWSQQYLKSVQANPMPEMLVLSRWLEAHVPPTDTDPSLTRISHGDYRLDNLVFHPSRADTVLAVLDWELSTLGDPLADLAYSCLPYHLPSGIPSLVSLPRPLPPGIPTEQEYIGQYCQARGIPSKLGTHWPFYMALSLFRLASILAGVGARAAQGNASSRIAAQVGADSVVRRLALTGLQLAGQHVALTGTPAEPYVSPAHPSARLDPNPVLEGTPSEEYANPTPAWRHAAARAEAAREHAEVALASSTTSTGPSPDAAPGTYIRGSSHGTPATLAAAASSSKAGPGSSGDGGDGSGADRSTRPMYGLGPSPRVRPTLQRLQAFMQQHVYPAEATLDEHAQSDQRWTIHPLQEQLKVAAKEQGL